MTLGRLLAIILCTTALTVSAATTHVITMKNLFFCPPLSALKKVPKKMTWYADDSTTKNAKSPSTNTKASQDHSWKSYSQSFVNKIGHFIGAQWVGSQVGQLTCLYQGKIKTTFPILLIYHTLTLSPQGGAWSKNLGGYHNCRNHLQKNCPFKIRLKSKNGDLYEQLEQLKNTRSQQTISID